MAETALPLPLLLDAALRGGLMALLALLAALLGRDRARSAPARMGMALALGLLLQLPSSAPWFEARVPLVWQQPLVGLSTANAVLFWLFSRSLFDDEFRPRWRHAVLWLAVVLVAALNCGLPRWAPDVPGLQTLAAALRWLPLPFALAAVLAAAAHWRTDLVERRRALRATIVLGGAAYTLLMLALRRASSQGRLSSEAALLDLAALGLLVGLLAWRLLRLGADDLLPSEPESRPAPAPAGPPVTMPAVPPAGSDPADERLAQALDALMREQHAYRDEDLGIASLARRLGAPEYRLRRVINQRLGHRNFNAFINGWRLAEAQAALADPGRRERPVLSIALEAGFQSIGPFNRAFKAATGLTPTEFRRQKLADS